MKKNKDINDEQKVFAHATIQWAMGIYANTTQSAEK